MENGQKKLIMESLKIKMQVGLNQYLGILNLKIYSAFLSGMILNGINEKTAHKIAGSNWLNFMKNHF